MKTATTNGHKRCLYYVKRRHARCQGSSSSALSKDIRLWNDWIYEPKLFMIVLSKIAYAIWQQLNHSTRTLSAHRLRIISHFHAWNPIIKEQAIKFKRMNIIDWRDLQDTIRNSFIFEQTHSIFSSSYKAVYCKKELWHTTGVRHAEPCHSVQ